MEVIVYKNDAGAMSIIYPESYFLNKYGIEAIAKKDVPAGKLYKIMDSSELPDKSSRDEWILDDSELKDGVGGELNEFTSP